MVKVCRICDIEKDIGFFFMRKDTGKYRTECKSCSNIIKGRNKKVTSLKKLDTDSKEYKKLKARNDKGNRDRAKKVKESNLDKLKIDLAKPIRRCTCCKEEKPKSEFDKYKSVRYNRIIFRSRCKVCLKVARNKKYKTDKGIFKSYRNGAKRRGYNFNLEFEHFSNIINSDCFYCGTKNCRGCDRVDNTIGYSVENCVPCCRRCNEIKMTRSVDELYIHIRKMANHFNKNKKVITDRFAPK